MTSSLESKRLRKQAEALDTVTAKRLELEAAHRDYRAAIVGADKAGVPASSIAEAAALSRPRIYQILKEEDEGNGNREA